jgi:hypothetical protein
MLQVLLIQILRAAQLLWQLSFACSPCLSCSRCHDVRAECCAVVHVPHAVLLYAAGWALSVAMSRAFGFKRLGGWALVPLVDMANHALVSNAEIRFGNDGVVRMMANKQVRGHNSVLMTRMPAENSHGAGCGCDGE